ncbi:MFS transporter [Mumia zhuanghuii]|uniref:MFS transporter n=2 Tax=Mumia TaxID=1546255 RepID=A0ABW1QP31_9ACTN|nr:MULTISPECIES: MFS transporter [Mumia]KAA1422376.1 MFS transporter [Mumia zhuanghuii]
MARRGVHRGDALPRALRPKRTRAEIIANVLLATGLAVVLVVVLPVGWLRAYDSALLLTGAAMLVGWAALEIGSLAPHTDEPKREFRLRRFATVFTVGGLLAQLVALIQIARIGRGWWALFMVGVVAYAIGKVLELYVTRDERAAQQERDQEKWAYEHRRREAARFAAYEAYEAATRPRTDAGAPDTHP